MALYPASVEAACSTAQEGTWRQQASPDGEIHELCVGGAWKAFRSYDTTTGTTTYEKRITTEKGVQIGNDVVCASPADEGTLRFNLAAAGVPGTTDGLVGHWKLDESAPAATAVDSVGSNDGTLTNMAPASDWVAGKIGNALDFDGGNDYVDVGSPAALDDLPQLSVSAWINADSTASDGAVATKNSPGWVFWVGSGGYLEFWANFSSGSANRWTGVGLITSGAGWQHVVVTYDGTSNGTGIKFYVDGSETSYNGSTNGTNPRSSDAADNLRIGSQQSGSRFDGQIDDVRIYDRVLSSAEISEIYNNQIPSPLQHCDGSDWKSFQ